MNPEKHVLDAIDELVNEQLAVGPVDDYGRNYYPQCNLCSHDWHGEECDACSCKRSTAEVVVRPVRREIDWDVLTDGALPYSELEEEWRRRESRELGYIERAPWVNYHEDEDSRYSQQFSPDSDGFVPLGISDEDQLVGEFNRHIHQLDAEGICVYADCPDQQQPPRGYTIADLRAMQRRDWRPHHYSQVSSIRQDYPQRYILGHEQDRPRIRFWKYDTEEARFQLIEGSAEVMHITWTREGVTVEVRLEPYGELVVDEEDTALRPASTPIPPDMIAMEGFQDGQFTTVGYLHPDDLTIEHNREWGRAAFGREAALLQDEHRVTMRIDGGRQGAPDIEPLRELLERGQ